MKKLKLNLQHLEGIEVLTREQLKKVMGGVSGSGYGGACTDDFTCWNSAGPDSYCDNGTCVPLPGGSAGCGPNTPVNQQCTLSHYGCCPMPTQQCLNSGVGYTCV